MSWGFLEDLGKAWKEVKGWVQESWGKRIPSRVWKKAWKSGWAQWWWWRTGEGSEGSGSECPPQGRGCLSGDSDKPPLLWRRGRNRPQRAWVGACAGSFWQKAFVKNFWTAKEISPQFSWVKIQLPVSLHLTYPHYLISRFCPFTIRFLKLLKWWGRKENVNCFS